MSNDSDFTFRGQHDGEDVLLVINLHPWSLAKEALIALVAVVIIVAMLVWFQASAPAMWTLIVLGSITLLYVFYVWYVWSQNMYILTNERVIVVRCKSLISRQFTDYGLEKIQSLGAEIEGLAASVLGFGNVTIAIMGLKDQIELNYVEDAYDFQNRIQDAIKKSEGHSVKSSNSSSEKLDKPRKLRVK